MKTAALLASSLFLLAPFLSPATELLHTADGSKDVNALPASENRWQTRRISTRESLDTLYKSLARLDFFALEYGESFPETAFDTTGTNGFSRLFGYSKKTGGAGIRFGRGWNRYVMSRYGYDIDVDQTDDTDWVLTFNTPSGNVREQPFSVKGKGRVKVSRTIGMMVTLVDNTEISGLELSCRTKGVKGVIHAFRLVPRVVPITWRRTFSLAEDPARAGLTMRNYALFTLRVNGHVIGEGNAHFGNGYRRFDLTKCLTAGLNEVSVEAETAGGYGPSTMFTAELFAVANDGATARYDSDDKWEYSLDGETWEKPMVWDRVGFEENRDVGRYASSTLPLHAGPIDVKPDDPNGYPVFDCDRPVRWFANLPRGVKEPKLTAVARQTLDREGKLIASDKAPSFAGRGDLRAIVFEKLPVGAYEITWRLFSGTREIDTLRNEMVVCGPIGQTEVSADDFENVLQPRLKLIESVDCTKEEKDDTKFLDHSDPGLPRVNVGKVVDLGHGIRARETGPGELSFFSYKLEVGRLGAPHILEIDLPDVREQMLYCWIGESYRVGFCNNGGELGSQAWPNATGSFKCGGLMPLTGKVRKERIVFFPGSRLITASFEKGKFGGPAAVCGFRVYEVEGDLPALKVPPTARRYGNHNERQVYSDWGTYVDPAAVRHEMTDLSPRAWTAAFAAARNRTAYLRYAGHNAAIEGAYMYRNGFPTRSGESANYDEDFDFRYPMLKLYRHNGIHTFLGYEYMRSPALGQKGLLDVSDREVQAGTSRTVYEVAKDGRQHVAYMGNGINFLNPDVHASMMNVLREIYTRYAPAGDIEGLFVITGGWWLPGIVIGYGDGVKDVSYDDDTIELFEKETGIRLGCGWSGRERFMRRYEKLNGEHAKTWYDWRAKKMRDVLEEMRGVVTSGPQKWEVFASGNRAFDPINPFSRLGATPGERRTYEAEMRAKSGYPVELYGEGSGSPIRVLPQGEFGREIYLDDYGSLFNPGAAAIRWKSDGFYNTCGSLNEHWIRCPAAKRWWWFTNGVCVYDAKQCGENAFFDCVEACAAYTPKYVFHTWTDVNVTSGHADECRRFLAGFYATPLDRHPTDVPSVKGIAAKRYGDAVQLVNATPWGVSGKVKVEKRGEGEGEGEGRGEGEEMVIPPYGIKVLPVGKGTVEGAFKMAPGCPYADFAAARKAYDYETMRAADCRKHAEKGRLNQNRLLAMLEKDGVVRIDAGKDSDTVDEKGRLWLADQPYAGSDTYGNEFAHYIDRGPIAIANTERPSVYRTESGAGVERIIYHFPVPKGTYRLVCHIAETWDAIPGHIMNVSVNGEKRTIDIWKTCGGRMRAGTFTFDDIRVTAGGEIVYDSNVRPIVNAFEIHRTDAAPAAAAKASLKDLSRYYTRRGGMETARTALKADQRGIQWLKIPRTYGPHGPVHPGTPYEKQMQAELVTTWGGSPECQMSRYPASLWWAQYKPGGRETSSHTVFFDSSVAADAMAQDPDLAERQFETIIRQCFRFSPYQSRALVHADIEPFVAAYKAGKEPVAIARTEALAAHYDLPSLNLAKAAAEGGERGVMDALSAFVRNVMGREGAVKPRYTNAKLPPPKNAGICDQCHIFTYEDGAVRKIGDWKIGVKSPSGAYMSAMAPTKAGDRLEVEFRGTEIGLVDFTSDDGTAYAYRVDKGDWKDLPAEAAEPGRAFRERHLPFAKGLFYNGAVSAKDDSDRHTLEMKVVKPGNGVIVGFLLNGSTADEDAGVGRSPETLAEVDGAWKGMEPIAYEPPVGRHANLAKTMARLKDGPSLNIVALGDSIVADTWRSKFWLLMGRDYPKCKLSCVCSVRSSTGCWWYKDDNRVESWVFSHKPDLVVIGGVSQKDDIESIRSVIRQIRAKDPGMEILLLTPVFGVENNARQAGWNVGWNYDPEKAEHPFRLQLKRLAEEEKCAFFDINAPWRKYILDSGKDIGYFHRDGVHANTRGEQLVGHLLERWFAPVR